MKTTRTTVLLGLLGFVLTLTPDLQAGSGCTNGYLQGSYGGEITGSIAAAPSSTSSIPASVLNLSRLYFDGQGNVAGTGTISTADATATSHITGTYSVNNDCTVSFAFTDSVAGTQNFSGVLVSAGESVYLAQTDKGISLAGTLERARNSCTLTDFNGSYGFLRSSTGSAPAAGSVGLINSDGNGNFTLTEALAGSGSAGWNASAGTYVVGDDCSVTLTVNPDTNAAHVIHATLTKDGRGLFSIETRSNVTVSGYFDVQ
jgi:hypothetical protein